MSVVPESVLKAFNAYHEKPSPEGKAAVDAAIAEADNAATEEAKKNAPPEKYALTAPDNVYTTPDDINELADTAKKLGMSQAAAQAQLTRDHNIRKANTLRMAELEKAQIKTWTDSIEAKYPGDKKNEVLTKSATTIQHLEKTNPGLADYLNKSGEGNNPLLLESFAKLHDDLKLGDAKTPNGGAGGGTDKTSTEAELKSWGLEKPVGHTAQS